MTVDFIQVRENAAKEGIDLQQIAIKWEGLSLAELSQLESAGLLTHRLADSSALGKFAEDGGVLFSEKATAVLYLGA